MPCCRQSFIAKSVDVGADAAADDDDDVELDDNNV